MLPFYLILLLLSPDAGWGVDRALQKNTYQLADRSGLYLVSLSEKKVSVREKFHIKARIDLKLEGDFDGFVGFLEAMAQDQWAIGSRLEIKAGQPCCFRVALEQHTLCQERFPASKARREQAAVF